MAIVVGMTSVLKKILTFEFNDWPKCPTFIRESILEVLGKAIRDAGVYDVLAPMFIQFCSDAKVTGILEFGAGSGESTVIFLDAICRSDHTPPRIYVSDLYPLTMVMQKNCEQHSGLLTPIRHSVDLRYPPETPTHDMRMVLSAFHHFDPDVARLFLADAKRRGIAVFIAEPFIGSIKAFFPLFIHGFPNLARNGMLSSKKRVLKLLFTFFVPLIPMCLLWDGLVSMIRMYDKRGFADLVASLPETETAYRWQYREVQVPLGGTAAVFSGRPVSVDVGSDL